MSSGKRLVEFQLRKGDRAAFRAVIVMAVDALELMDLHPCSTPSALFTYVDTSDTESDDPLAMPSLASSRPGRSVAPTDDLMRSIAIGLDSAYVDVKLNTLHIVAGMCSSASGSEAIARDQKCLQSVISCMSSKHDPVALVALDVVCGMASSSTHRELLVESGAVDALIAVFECGRREIVQHALRYMNSLEGIAHHPCWNRISTSIDQLQFAVSARSTESTSGFSFIQTSLSSNSFEDPYRRSDMSSSYPHSL